MARLSMSFEHGQRPEVAQAKFQAAIRQAEASFGAWIQRVDWAENGQSATLTGSGFEVRCWYDERELHIEGSIPLAWKLLEGAIRSHIKRDIDRELTVHHT